MVVKSQHEFSKDSLVTFQISYLLKREHLSNVILADIRVKRGV